MKNYEGKSTNFYDSERNYFFDRKVLADRKLYPGDTWKKTHYHLFGYYPKDWDDMLTYTSDKDYRMEKYLQENPLATENFKGNKKDLSENIDFYDAIYETVKFVTGKEPDLKELLIHKLSGEGSVDNFYMRSLIKKSIERVSDAMKIIHTDGLNRFLRLNPDSEFAKLKDCGVTTVTVGYICINKVFWANINQKNQAVEAAKEKANDKAKEALKEGKFTKYLNIKSKLYSDEVIKTITESFNKAVIPTFKDASKQGKEFFKVVEKAVKSGNFRLANLKETKNGFSFVLKNKDIRFDFDDKGNVNYKITPVSFEEQAAK